MAYGELSPYEIQVNSGGRQVGFCVNPGQLPYRYSCVTVDGQDLYTGKIIANGAGALTTGTSGTTVTETPDVNEYTCSPKFSAFSTCPYAVPSGNVWTSSTSYAVGAVVDYNGQTFQAAVANSDKAPVLITNGSNPQVGNACASNTYLNAGKQPVCTWVQLYHSASGNNNTGTITLSAGTYKIQSNGIGVLSITNVGDTHSTNFMLAVPPLAAGQQIQVFGQPTITNQITGTGVLIKQ